MRYMSTHLLLTRPLWYANLCNPNHCALIGLVYLFANV